MKEIKAKSRFRLFIDSLKLAVLNALLPSEFRITRMTTAPDVYRIDLPPTVGIQGTDEFFLLQPTRLHFVTHGIVSAGGVISINPPSMKGIVSEEGIEEHCEGLLDQTRKKLMREHLHHDRKARRLALAAKRFPELKPVVGYLLEGTKHASRR
jgi:hypothetical protein